MVVGLVLIGSTPVMAALDAYMTATGETQGVIQGSVDQAGREGSMLIVEFGHAVSEGVETDGYPLNGIKQHRPIRVTKDIDKATPLLLNVYTQDENLTEVEIKFWQPTNSGAEEQFYTIKLLNARIVNITQLSGSTGDLLSVPPRETITMIYSKIIWTWEDGGITAEDDHPGVN